MAEPMPGPWFVECQSSDVIEIQDEGGYCVAILGDSENRVDHANLLAASPDLLAVAQQWLDWWNSPRGVGMAGPTCDILVATEAAIAKAGGSQDKPGPTAL